MRGGFSGGSALPPEGEGRRQHSREMAVVHLLVTDQ